jgi:two-component system chemotaxis sensor kinase CheA
MAKDPYRYFRVEARELLEGLMQGTLQLEKGIAAPDIVARMLRLAHTLKGAARVVKQPEIASRAHTIEEVVSSQRDSGLPLTPEQGSDLVRLLDEISVRVGALEPAADFHGPLPIRAVAEEPLETLRVEVDAIDALFRGVAEASVQLQAIRKGVEATDRLTHTARLLLGQLATLPDEHSGEALQGLARTRSLAEDLCSGLDRFQRALSVDVERASSEVTEIQEVAHRLRLTPARTVFPSLERAVRDAALALGKHVDFEVDGGDIRLDASVLGALRDALAHVVRNAVVHGIETPALRTAAGKAVPAHVRLVVERRGSRVAFVCSDDGRGVDVEAVKIAAVARGLVSDAAAHDLSRDGIIAMLRTGGLSTSTHVTELSGRGIGLDVARETAVRLKGELGIRSEVGQGTTVEILVPVSIASMQGLVVEVAGSLVVIPLDAVRQAVRVEEADIVRSVAVSSILFQGSFIPFLPLDRALRRSRPPVQDRRSWSAVVVEVGDRSVAVGVDRLRGTSHIVMRSLSNVVEVDPIIAGASLDAEGHPQLVLDPKGLIDMAHRVADFAEDEAKTERAPILVIDDSLTTRMLERSILESAGYTVELAVSAEDALMKSRDRRHALFLVDVEMPGMDGFEFVAATRADPALRDTPAILMTSRNAPEDRRRGEQVGAHAYIVKSEFDQQRLLQIIRTLVG